MIYRWHHVNSTKHSPWWRFCKMVCTTEVFEDIFIKNMAMATKITNRNIFWGRRSFTFHDEIIQLLYQIPTQRVIMIIELLMIRIVLLLRLLVQPVFSQLASLRKLRIILLHLPLDWHQEYMTRHQRKDITANEAYFAGICVRYTYMQLVQTIQPFLAVIGYNIKRVVKEPTFDVFWKDS